MKKILLIGVTITVNTWCIAQNVGIGTVSPVNKLDVYDLSNAATIGVSSGTSSAYAELKASVAGSGMSLTKYGVSAVGSFNSWSNGDLLLLNNNSGSLLINTADSLALSVNGVNKIKIRKTGEVMINGSTYNASNVGYLYVDYPSYSPTKPAFEMNGSNIWMGFRDGGAYKGYIQQNGDDMNITSFVGSLTLRANSMSRITITKAGGVGINTIYPNADLDVLGSGNYTAAGVFSNSGSRLSFSAGDTGTLAVYNNYAGTNYAYALTSKINSTNGYAAYFNAKFCGVRVDVAGGSGMYGFGGYFTASNTNTSNYGATGIATGISSTNYGVYASASGGTTNYSLYCAGNGVYTGTWTQSSDRKLKNNIQPIARGLDLVLQLKPSTYEYKTKDTAYKEMNLATGLHYGFIAQDIEQVIPSVVQDNFQQKPGTSAKPISFKSVNYVELIPVLTRAIQEQNTLIVELRNELEALKKQVNTK